MYYNELKHKINTSSQLNIEYVIKTMGYTIEKENLSIVRGDVISTAASINMHF